MRIWIWLACAACGGAGPSPITEAAGTLGSLAITSAAELVAPGIVSSPYAEIRLAASPDGMMVLWGSTDRPGGPGGWDIWVARRTGPEAAFGTPEPAPFDSPANDFDPAFSADGRWLYFFSNRPGGFGGDDLYRAPVTAGGFGPAQHLGAEINTAGDEWAPAPSPDGTLLMFASNRPGAKHDLYITRVSGNEASALASSTSTAYATRCGERTDAGGGSDTQTCEHRQRRPGRRPCLVRRRSLAPRPEPGATATGCGDPRSPRP